VASPTTQSAAASRSIGRAIERGEIPLATAAVYSRSATNRPYPRVEATIRERGTVK
jgi:hypothetical protein